MKTILVFAFIIPNLYLTFADWEHPHYSYRCLENGDVELFGMHEKSAIQVDSSPNCTSKPNPKTKVHLINATCLNGKENATISVYDNMLDGVYQIPLTPHPTVAHDVVGGHTGHQFVITCKDIPNQGISKTVAHVFQGRVYNQLPDNYKEVSPVEMRFKAVNDLSAPDISSVYIGDEFYMFIKYMGENKDYFVVPEECTAIGGTSLAEGRLTSGENSIVLWNNSNTACAPQNALLEKFIRENNTIIYAKMYGFKFTEYDFITITCEVKIFKEQNEDRCVSTTPKPTTPTTKTTTTKAPTTKSTTTKAPTTKSTTTKAPTTKATTTNTPPAKQGKRRKRAIVNTLFQNKRIAKTLWVYDNRNVQLAENGSQKIKLDVPLWIVFFVIVTSR